MISSYRQLTGKYLKTNKKRTLLTIIGIILSVSLISSIGLFFKGIQLSQIEDMKNRYGSWHLAFSKADENLISKVTNNPRVARSGLFTQSPEIKVGEKLSMVEMLASNKALELLPYKAKEGRLPENEHEAAVEKWALGYINKDAKIGDKISLGGKEYILSGILEDNITNQMDSKGVILSKSDHISSNAVLLAEISSRTNIKSAVKELRQLGEIGTVQENTYLLTVQGASDNASFLTGLYIAIGVIIGIVLVSTIAVIYNSFQISVVERIKQFGLLRAVGTTPGQIRKIVLREATFLAAIGVPIGLFFGVVAIYGIDIAFKLIGRDAVNFTKPSVSPDILAIGAIVGIASIYISALIPAFFAGRISPLIAISSRTSITKEKIKRQKNLIAGKIFGFEGALASKNIKRNRKRYRITVFSIVISVVLFVSFKSFMDMSMKISSDLNASYDIHFSIVRNVQATKENLTIDKPTEEFLQSAKSIDKLFRVYEPYYFQAVVNKSSELKDIKNIGKENAPIYGSTTFEGEEKTLMGASIAAYDANSMEVAKKYLESGSIDLEKLNSENGVILINENRIYNDATKNFYYGSIANIKVGDEIALQYNTSFGENPDFGSRPVHKVKVMALLKTEPFNFRGAQDGLKIITTEDLAKKLSGKDSLGLINLNISIKDIKYEDVAKAEITEAIKTNPALEIINNIDSNRNEKSSLLMVQILVYGFVIVVSLIGSVNIINTLTTNIILRRREFAALKSIGLTQKGLKKMIVLEGLLYGIMGSIYGSIIGSGLSYVMFYGLSGVREFSWRIPWNAIAIAGICSLVIGYLSVLSPLARINKENLIEAIRDEY